MYTRIIKQKNKNGTIREYLQILESYRENGKVKQRILATWGKLGQEITTKKIDQLMESLSRHAGKVQICNILKDLKSKASKGYGELEIFRKVFKELGLEKSLRAKLSETDKKIDYVEAMFMAICNRLKDPASKKGTSEWKESMYQPKWEQLELQHIYRGMDFLVAQKDEIEGELFDQTRDLFNSKVNVAMFDTTTVQYWGEGKDEIFQYGHSKSKRFDLKQLVVGIIMDRDGTPLGHEVWPGNMSDKPAFKQVIDKVKQKFMIDKVILVCDRGMVSDENIKYLEEQKYEYILGMKMRSLGDIRQRLLFNDEGFEPVGVGQRLAKEIREGELWEKEKIEKRELKKAKGVSPKPLDAEAIQKYKNSSAGKRRWIVCLNPILAEQDKHKREYFQKILENKVEFSTAKQWIIKNGYKKYVTIKDMSIELDRDRLEADAFYDGKWCLMTNTSFPIQSIVRAYKDLATIESHFRTLKSELELGPVYHWTEKRVRAHVFICFLALQIRTYISKKLKEYDPTLSYKQVMRDVNEIKVNIYELKGKRYAQRTDFQGKAHIAFRVTGTKIPPEFLDVSDIPQFSDKPQESVVTTS